MIEISLIPELDHANAGTVHWMGRTSQVATPIGEVRATATGVVTVNEVPLTLDQAKELIEALKFAAGACQAWVRHTGRYNAFRVTREDGKVFCEWRDRRGELRLKRARKPHECYRCKAPVLRIWVPVHAPWQGHHEVQAKLCEECLPKCEVVRSGLRAV